MNRYFTTACFLGFVLLSGWWQSRLGVNFSEVYVRIPDAVDAADVSVFAQLQTGAVSRMQPQQRDTRLRVSGNPVAVKSLWIAGATPEEVRTFDVKAGSGWLMATRLEITEVRLVTAAEGTAPGIPEPLKTDTAIEVFTERLGWSSGWLGGDGINWCGDGWFAAAILVQAIWCVVTLRLCWWMWRGFAFGGGATALESAGGWSGLNSLLLQVPRLIFLVLLLHQAWWAILELSVLRGPAEYVAGALVFGLLVLLYLLWARCVEQAATRRGLILRMLAVGCLLTGLKVLWVSTVDYQASSDYAKYENLGRWLAAGDWDAIRGMSRDNFAPIYLMRAWGYMYPVCLLFDSGRTALELSNCFVQGISVLLMCVLISRASDLKTAARFLPLAFVYPEFWYSAGMVSHNVPGYFWIPVCWLVVDRFDSMCRRESVSGWWQLVRCCGIAIATGAVMGFSLSMLNLAKTYGALFLVSLLLFLVFRRFFSQRGSAVDASFPRLPERMIFLAAVTGVYLTVTSSVLTGLHEKTQFPLKAYGTPATIAGLDMTSSDPGKSANIWLVQFVETCPERLRMQLIYRRLLHEYIANGHRVYQSVLLKNKNMGRPVEAMVHVGDELARGEMLHSARFMRLPVFQKALGWHFALWLVLAGAARLLAVGRTPGATGEVFPWLTAGVTLIAAYILTDGVSYSGMNYAYPLCWTAAMLVPGLRGQRSSADRATAAEHATVPDWRRALQPGRLAAGVVLCGILAALHMAAGYVVDRSGLTFYRIVEVQPEGDGETKAGRDDSQRAGETYVSRLHAGVRFRPADQMLHAGDSVVGRFRVSSDGGPLRGVRFFVTSNSRFYQTATQRIREEALAQSWKDVPIDYVLMVEGRELKRAPLERVRGSRYVELPADYWREGQPAAATPVNSVDFTLKLECHGDVDLRNMPWPPSLAVEFFH